MIIHTQVAVKLARIAIALSLLATGCSASSPASSDRSDSPQPQSNSELLSSSGVKADGSSTVYPITQMAAEAFKKANPNVEIDIQFSGTTGGFRKFCAGETDISNASRPISSAELSACRTAGVPFIELPIAFDALAVVVHPQNSWVQELTVSELKKIWETAAQGKILTWDQVRPDFPKKPIQLYGPGQDSGTYDYFAEVITGEASLRGDYTGSEDDNDLVAGVAQDPNALGFFGFSYYEKNRDRLKVVAIADDSQGSLTEAVTPSAEAVEKALYQPLSRPLFIYVNGKSAQANEELQEFVKFYMENSSRIVSATDYIPLVPEAYDIARSHLLKGEYGTAYDGKPQAYLTILEVLQKEQSL